MSDGRRNNSSQMKEALQHEETREPEREHKSKGSTSQEHKSKESMSQASCSSSPSSSVPSSTRDAIGRQMGGDEVARTQTEDGSSSCCRLDDLKRLPQCDNKLGRLSFSMTHTVLVDVRFKVKIPQCKILHAVKYYQLNILKIQQVKVVIVQ